MRELRKLGLVPIALSRSWVDYTDPLQLESWVKDARIQLIINAAGYTGRTVDDCEKHKEDCYAANVSFVRSLAKMCVDLDVALFHISSGCIFDGPGPFKEEDLPNNHSQFYAHTKIEAENELFSTDCRAWIFRIRMPFGHRDHPRNWLTKLKNYPLILDGLNSVTYLDQFVRRSYRLAHQSAPGVYHAACSTPIRTADVATLLHQNGIRELPVEIFAPGSFKACGHTHRSQTVFGCLKVREGVWKAFLALRSFLWSGVCVTSVLQTHHPGVKDSKNETNPTPHLRASAVHRSHHWLRELETSDLQIHRDSCHHS